MNKLKILVVDDDESILALYRIALSPDMFEPRYVGNGKEALELYRSWKPDIIILDIMIPGMTGYHVLQKIREENRDTSTTILLASSLSEESANKYCQEFGIQGYLAKPFNYKEIGAMIIKCHQMQKEKSVYSKPETCNKT
jgi:DNA-binding response OmpR family regulator